ncbi:retrovirus-related Pol polyprotein from transposon 297 [Trichonephila clavipes]|nr:retrovirus-related Pol polyprotein from transposon 297 [Trichonephila clavipes]
MAISWGGGCQILETLSRAWFHSRLQQERITFHTRRSHYIQIEHRIESIRQVTTNENITIPPRTEIIVPGYIGNDVSFNSGLIGSAENKANGFANSFDASGPFQKNYPEKLRRKTVQEFEDVFSRNSSDIGHTTVTQHRIDTADHPPIKQHPRRLPFAKQEEVGTLLREMQENDIIELMGIPIVLVRVRTDPEKVSAVKNWKRPENLRELRSFLGLCTYYRKVYGVFKPSWQDISAYSPTTKSSIGPLWNFSTSQEWCSIPKRIWKDIQVAISTSFPRSRIPEVLKELHGSPTGGHFGVMKTLHRVRERFFWGKVRADVEQWVQVL